MALRESMREPTTPWVVHTVGEGDSGKAMIRRKGLIILSPPTFSPRCVPG